MPDRLQRRLIALTAGLWRAIDAARAETGESSAALIERLLRRSRELRVRAGALGDRPTHGGARRRSDGRRS